MAVRSSILIVDDDPDIRKVLNLLLNTTYDVAEVEDGASAIDYIREHPETDLVLLDVMMPGMSGLETCNELRRYSNAPVRRSAPSCAATGSTAASPTAPSPSRISMSILRAAR